VGDKYYFAKGLDVKKDQSYYLCLLKDYQREVIEFPIGEMDKTEVKALAAKLGLSVAEKKESQDICFLQGRDYRQFLEDKLDKSAIKKGWFIKDGERLKEHDGIIYYTIGQRKGLGIGYHKPLFVKSIDAETGDVEVSSKDEVQGRGVKVHDFVYPEDHDRIFNAEVKIRYRMAPVPCKVEIHPDNKATILFDKPEFAPTPGQIACIYENDMVTCGGYIQSVF